MLILRKISFWLALLGLVATAMLVLDLRAELNKPPPPTPITPPAKPFLRGGIGAAGLVEALRENTAVGVPAPGLVTQVFVTPWAEVQPGDPLFQLDDRELQAALLTQRANSLVAEASLARLQEQLTRLETVDDPRAVSAEEIKTRRNDVAIATAQIGVTRAVIAQTEILIARLTVRAPIAGTILQVNIRPGEYASPSTATPPLLLGDLREVQVRAEVDEQIAPRVKPGKNAVGYVKGDTAFPIPMTFVRIEPYVVPKRSLTGLSTERVDTRVLQVIFKFDHPADRPLYVGQQIDLYIEE